MIWATLKANIWATLFGGLSAILLAVCAYQNVQIHGFLWIDGLNDKLADCETDKNELRSERDQLIAAAKEAERLNKEQVQRIVTEQDRISDNVEADLNARIERLRRELRTKADNGHSEGSGAGTVPPPTGAAPNQARLCLEADQLLRAAENEERHEQLIRWVEQQLNVKR